MDEMNRWTDGTETDVSRWTDRTDRQMEQIDRCEQVNRGNRWTDMNRWTERTDRQM